MGKINWGRVFLSGLLAGAVGAMLLGLAVGFLGRDFMTAVQAVARRDPRTSPGYLVFFIVLNFLYGIWTMWLYAAIRPRYGPGPMTAAVAGFALWLIGSLADAFWASLGVIPPATLVVPVAAALPIIVLAAVVGAWLYKE